jgi:protocatechuate 3,4-dioxygenase beta subunit
LGQADEGKFPKSTFLERKIMSTKTITKRIALVAAAALALGGVSVVTATSANAAYTPTVLYTTMYDRTLGYQVVGGEATVTVRMDSLTAATVTSSGVGTIQSAGYAPSSVAGHGIGIDTLTAVTSTSFRKPAGSTTEDYAYDSVTVVLVSSVVGTQTLTITPIDGDGIPGTAVTKTVTWTASGTTAAASWSAYLMDSATGGIGIAPTDSDIAISKDKAASTQVAIIAAKLKDGNGNPVNAALVSVTVSGPGFIEAQIPGTSDGTGTSVSPAPAKRVDSVTTDQYGWVHVAIAGDGTAGVSTVTLTSGTASVSRSITFTGVAASYTLTNLTTTYGIGNYGTGDDNQAYVAATDTAGILVNGLDSAGGKVATGDFYAVSSNPLVASVTSAVKAHNAVGTVVGVTGVSVGTATITIRNGSTAALSTVTKTIQVEVSTGTAATVTMALDKAEYQPGEPGVLSITLTNAAGRPVADGTYTIFAATAPLSSNLFMQNNASGSNDTFTAGATSVTTVGGVAAFDIYAPSFSGTLTITATTLGATTSSSALATGAVRGAVLAATATVSGGAADANAALALDAANAATDAANNAYDEAQNATQAASDALAAVTALAAQVKTLIASVKKLTAAVAKLKK